jgi:hypothetical protein
MRCGIQTKGNDSLTRAVMMVGDRRSSATTRRGDCRAVCVQPSHKPRPVPLVRSNWTPSPHTLSTVNKLKAPPLLLEPTFDLVPCTRLLLLQGEALVLRYQSFPLCRSQICRDPERGLTSRAILPNTAGFMYTARFDTQWSISHRPWLTCASMPRR